jgi:hypothetical protein
MINAVMYGTVEITPLVIRSPGREQDAGDLPRDVRSCRGEPWFARWSFALAVSVANGSKPAVVLVVEDAACFSTSRTVWTMSRTLAGAWLRLRASGDDATPDEAPRADEVIG